MTPMINDTRTGGVSGQLVVGGMIVLLGVLLLLDRTGLVEWTSRGNWWPFLIIGLGLARMISPRRPGSRGGFWLVAIGVWALLNEYDIMHYRESWPLFLVVVGVSMMWRARGGSAHTRRGMPHVD